MLISDKVPPCVCYWAYTHARDAREVYHAAGPPWMIGLACIWSGVCQRCSKTFGFHRAFISPSPSLPPSHSHYHTHHTHTRTHAHTHKLSHTHTHITQHCPCYNTTSPSHQSHTSTRLPTPQVSPCSPPEAIESRISTRWPNSETPRSFIRLLSERRPMFLWSMY